MANEFYFYGREKSKNKLTDIDRNAANNVKSRDFAAGFMMVMGCVALVLFFLFASFGKGCDSIDYSDYASDEYGGAISVFSQFVYRGDGNDKSLQNSNPIKGSENSEKEETTNAENVFSKDTGRWNFWEYLCDSLAEIFGVANAE